MPIKKPTEAAFKRVTGTIVTDKQARFALLPHLYENEIDVALDALEAAGYVVIKPDAT